MGIEKKVEIANAKKRRAKLLREFESCGTTMGKFAAKKKLTPARMSKLLKMAREEV